MKRIQTTAIFSLFTASIFWIMLGGCSKTPDEKIHDLYVQALGQIDNFDYVEAESTIAQMGGVMTSSPWIPLARGIALEQRLEYWDALHQYRVARDAVVDFAPAYDRSARLFARLGLWEDAVDEAFACTKYTPDDAEAWLLAARCMIGGRLFERVPKLLQSAEENGAPKDVTAFIAAQSIFETGAWDSASALAGSISFDDKASVDKLTSAANYFETAGQWDTAMGLSRKAMESSEYDFEAIHDHFYRSLRTKHFMDARKVIERYRQERADSILVTGLEMLCYQATGHRMAGAQYSSLYREFAPTSHISPAYWDVRMREYQGDGDIGEQEINRLGQKMKKNNWLPDFQQYINDLMTLDVPYSIMPKTMNDRLGTMKPPWSQRGEFKIASARLRNRWGQTKEYDSTMMDLKKYHASDPNGMEDIADIYNPGSVFTSDSARAWYTAILNMQKWRPVTFLKYVSMCDRSRNYDLAIAACNQFPQYEQHLPQIAVMRAIDEVRTGKVDDGVARFAAHFPSLSGAVVYADTMIQALKKREAGDKAQKVYDLLASPALANNVDALMLLADHAWESADYKQSLSLCERAESFESNYGFLMARKARALFGVGEKEESFALFEKILLDYPRSTNAYLYYSQLLVNDPSQYDKAANWARAACVETGADLFESLNLCDIYNKVGRYDLLLGEGRKLLNIHPQEPEPPYWVGLALYLNKRDSVKMYLNNSIALGLKGDKLQKAQEILAQVR
jgi:tetratricopeptide (TPR) repeat protein